jgi:hypothetical protein
MDAGLLAVLGPGMTQERMDSEIKIKTPARDIARPAFVVQSVGEGGSEA